jgi:hypothetical protein
MEHLYLKTTNLLTLRGRLYFFDSDRGEYVWENFMREISDYKADLN